MIRKMLETAETDISPHGQGRGKLVFCSTSVPELFTEETILNFIHSAASGGKDSCGLYHFRMQQAGAGGGIFHG